MTDQKLNSIDQPEKESKNTQENDNNVEKDLVEVNGEKLTIEELKKGYMRQSDYTKKTQEVAKEKLTDQQKEALETLESLGVAKKDDIKKFLMEEREVQKKEQELKEIIASNPELAKYEKAIELLSKNLNQSVYEVVELYGFAEKNKLREASYSRQNIPGGNPNFLDNQKKKSFKDMTDDEFLNWSNQNS